MTVNLENYVEVHERIAAFYEKHPNGSLQSQWDVVPIGDQTVIVVEAKAYRTPSDPRPGVGLASEPVPGKTSFTKDSELMNAETSAWGRAIASLGFKVQRGIASASEVRNRSGSAPAAANAKPWSSAQKGAVTRGFNDRAIPDGEQRLRLVTWAGGKLGGDGVEMTVPQASKLIDLLKTAKDYADVWKRADLPSPQSANDLPADVPDPVSQPPLVEDALT